jgi:hypothetical protein
VTSHAWSSRVLLLAVVLLVVGHSAAWAQRAGGRGVKQWLGCWRIQMQDSTPRLARELLVQLDSVPAPTREGPQQYYGRGYEGFPRDGEWPFPLIWVSRAPDSVDISVVSLGGTGWRLQRSANSLRGVSYEFYDIGMNETMLGWARGLRQACP